MKKDIRNNDAGLGGAIIFYMFIAVIFLAVSSLGGCARPQAVVVTPNIEPPRKELMEESKLPAADIAEPDAFKRCVKNLASTRAQCGRNADKHNGLRKYVQEAVPSAKRVE